MKKCIISILIVILLSFSISPTYLFIDDTDKTSEIDIIEDKIITHPKINLASLYLKDTRFIMPDHGFFSPEKYELNVPESFSFKFIDYTIDSSTHVQSGTFAVRPTQVIVKTSIPLINLTFQAESLEATQLALDEMYSWFTIREKINQNNLGQPLKIERIDFAVSREYISDLIIIINDEDYLENTKEYVLFFDDGTNQDNIDIVMDTQPPVIFFPDLDSDQIILVQWGEPFDMNQFPVFNATDDRDLDLTASIYIPAGPNAILDTRVEADYVILLIVEDTWGNETEETFTFRVTKNPEAVS